MRLLTQATLIGLAAAALCACNQKDKAKVPESVPASPGASAEEKNQGMAGTQQPQAPKDEAAPAAQKAEAEKSQVIDKFRSELDTLGKEIDVLKAKSTKASKKTRVEFQKQIKALDKRRGELSVKLDKLGKETSESWQDFKARTGREVDSLKAAIKHLRKKEKV
jgi:hypothetical protein